MSIVYSNFINFLLIKDVDEKEKKVYHYTILSLVYYLRRDKIMKTLPIGVQVYSVRDFAEKDFKGTMQQLKEMGYDGVELAGLYDLEPSYIKEILDEIGLVPMSAHVPFRELCQDLEGTVEKYITIGIKYLAIPHLTDDEKPGSEYFLNFVMPELVKIGTYCKSKGITMVYHNHDFEFITMPNGEYGLDYIYSHIGADILETEIDTCWVNVAGVEPCEYVRKYSGRAPIVHLKDFIKEGEANDMYELIGIQQEKKEKSTGKFEFRPLGQGMQNIPALLEASIDSGALWVVVEQDKSYGIPSMESVQISIDYLKSLGW